jgi:hypothetical protein
MFCFFPGRFSPRRRYLRERMDWCYGALPYPALLIPAPSGTIGSAMSSPSAVRSIGGEENPKMCAVDSPRIQRRSGNAGIIPTVAAIQAPATALFSPTKGNLVDAFGNLPGRKGSPGLLQGIRGFLKGKIAPRNAVIGLAEGYFSLAGQFIPPARPPLPCEGAGLPCKTPSFPWKTSSFPVATSYFAGVCCVFAAAALAGRPG